jgi:LCP family protein required for cell wall assembly
MNKPEKRKVSIDGFIPRRAGDQIGGLHSIDHKKTIKPDTLEPKLMHTTGSSLTRDLGQINPDYDLDKANVYDGIETYPPESDPFFSEKPKKLSRKEKKLLKKQNKKPKTLTGKIIKWIIWLIVLGCVGYGGYFGYKFIATGNNIFLGSNVFGILQTSPIKKDANGRTNFLVLGTSEDDPGHEGANLTDSMMIVSISQDKKDAYMFSIPRDLYVEYGMACNAGYSGKINEYFSCSNQGDSAADEQDRLVKTQSFVGDIFGLDIQYGVHVNQTVIKEIVDAVGGVDVDIQGSGDAPGILDRNADWRCNYTCYYVKYDNGVHHLDGEHALYLSMARGHDAPTYGLSRSNFDREINQQKIIMAVKDKAVNTGIITNLSAITKLMDALGNNLRTNIKIDEIRTLMQVANDVKANDVHSVSLIDGNEKVMTTGMYGDASVVMPSAGIFQYDDLRAFIQKNLVNYAVFNESAPVAVLNASGIDGLAQREAGKLTDAGFNVIIISSAPDDSIASTERVAIYQIGDGNDATSKKLAEMFNVPVLISDPPVPVSGDVKFVVIFGPANN